MTAIRDRYIDTIRALAIVRVIVYHALNLGWLTIVFPSMGIMFALAGSLMAASMDKSGLVTVGRRLRRLLPSFWVLGAVAVSVMLIHGWTVDDRTAATDPRMLFWIVPLNSPPASDWGQEFVGVLWYISTYLWLVLLSPVLLPLFRRLPVVMLALPFLLVYLFSLNSYGMSDEITGPITDLCSYLACWLLGFAHHDGTLRRLRWRLVVPVALAAFVVGGWLAWTNRAESNFDLTADPMANTYWSFAFVLLLLRWQPKMSSPSRIPALDRLVSLLNARAVTIYLWHNPGIFFTGLLLAEVGLDTAPVNDAVLLLGTLLWTLAAVLLFGWIEDLAARRRPRLLPVGGGTRRVAAPAAAEAGDPSGQGGQDGQGHELDQQGRHSARR
ncbi:acyltransferase [Kitasatospora sp. NPDC028055]|uniref:acyltransferase family protein n=1 Tax=Kitasatospora sp. NPDC028055 TaxID=3155653 RepID=UPI0033E7BF08